MNYNDNLVNTPLKRFNKKCSIFKYIQQHNIENNNYEQSYLRKVKCKSEYIYFVVV